jgi:hypothetical protein
MKLVQIIKELEKPSPEKIYSPGQEPKDTSDKSTEILPGGEVMYYDAVKIVNDIKKVKKELKAYNVKKPNKIPNYSGINKSLEQIINILKQIRD